MILDALLDWLYPPRCVACRMILCLTAQDEGAFKKQGKYFCATCRVLLVPSRTPPEGPFGAAFPYCEVLAEMLHEIKFRNKRRVAEGLGFLLAEVAAGLVPPETDCIVPVPLHRSRERARGFNQAVVLARPVAQKLHIPLRADGLVRVRKTRPQAGLSVQARENNVARAFASRGDFAGKTVCLLDDIYTTGATMNACAQVLRENGAERVVGLSLALAERKTPEQKSQEPKPLT